MTATAKTLFVGLGSAHGDDQAGWLVAEILDGLCRENNAVSVRRALVPLDVLDWLDGIDVLHLCDACEFVPGRRRLLRFRWDAGRLVDLDPSEDHGALTVTARFRSRGSHDFSLPEMLRLAETIQALPKCVTIWAIAGSRLQPGDTMSEETRRTAMQAAQEILKDHSSPTKP